MQNNRIRSTIMRAIQSRKEDVEDVQTEQNAKMCDLQIALVRKKDECERLRAELNRQRRIQHEIDAERCVWQERYRALSLQMREIIAKTEGRIVQDAIADIKNERISSDD